MEFVDLYTCEIVDWSMDSRMTQTLVIDALKAAYWKKKLAPGMMHLLTMEVSIAVPLTVRCKLATAYKPQ